MLYRLCVIAALLAVAAASAANDLFEFTAWGLRHGVEFASEVEAASAFDTYRVNKAWVLKHQAEYAQGMHTYQVALNQYAHMTEEEFANRNKAAMPVREKDFVTKEHLLTVAGDVPDSMDWTTKGAVTPVKNQGQCGSCWAFSTTGSTEGRNAIANGKLVSLSEQQLVDCAAPEGNMGCNGGLMDQGFQFIIDNKGLTTEAAYGYTAAVGTCKTGQTAAVQITGFKDVPTADEDALKAAVASGPVSIAIEADQKGFQFYKSGVFSGECGTQLDHGVLLVGYGNENGQDYWKVKNSWGETWGESGYIRLVRGKGGVGQCGLATQPSYPVVGPSPSKISVDEHLAPGAVGEDMTEEVFQYLFDAWIELHGLQYSLIGERMHRFAVFKDNFAKISAHNKEYAAGKHGYHLGLNRFGAYTADEFTAFVKSGGILPPRSLRREMNSMSEAELVAAVGDVPETVDWTTKGAVTPVKNQGQCGSCWAFSTTGSTEGRNAIANGKLVSLSEQQLVDCAKKEGNMGCSGGLMDQGFQFIIDNKGITTEAAYGYTGADGTCESGKQAAVKITGFKDVAKGDEGALKAAVADGPVSVAIEADQMSFQFYAGGVFTGQCGTKLDHGVLVVGYGTEGGNDYWKVKNSWGGSWGESGYIRIQRNQGQAGGLCGIANQASFPVVA